MRVSRYWTAARIAKHLHDTVPALHEFNRSGQNIEQLAGGLHRMLSVHTRTSGSKPQVQLLARVAVAGLPGPVTSHRNDGLFGTAVTKAGRSWYPLPAADQSFGPDLLDDVTGPVLQMLLAAEDLRGFIVWAQKVFRGEERPGWWGRYQPVMPQGTGPLEAAAFAATMLGDGALVEHLAARVENEQGDEHYFANFCAELHQLWPRFRQRHPINPSMR